jgi:hypothetical protein
MRGLAIVRWKCQLLRATTASIPDWGKDGVIEWFSWRIAEDA